jgi:hypothetical protein
MYRFSLGPILGESAQREISHYIASRAPVEGIFGVLASCVQIKSTPKANWYLARLRLAPNYQNV